jgi:hypothetical protein
MGILSTFCQNAIYLLGASVLGLNLFWFEKIWMGLISNIGVDVDFQTF